MAIPDWIRRLVASGLTRLKLRSVTSRYARRFSYEGFTPRAARQLRRLERQTAELALQQFAYDVRWTTVDILKLSASGDESEARRRQMALMGRIMHGWIFEQLKMDPPHPCLYEFAQPLGLGLGRELRQWVRSHDFSPPQIAAWFQRHGPAIDRFIGTEAG